MIPKRESRFSEKIMPRGNIGAERRDKDAARHVPVNTGLRFSMNAVRPSV
jgi:hypothetical protein